MNTTADLNTLRACEQELADAVPFGNWRSIINRNLTLYDRGIEILAPRLPVARLFQERLQTMCVHQRFRLFGDPVVRTALKELLEGVKAGRPVNEGEPVEVVKSVLEALERVDALPVALGGAALEVDLPPHRAYVWSVQRTEDVFSRRFQALFDREIAPSISSRAAVLRQPTSAMCQTLQQATELLDELLPEASRSVMAHVQLICIVDVSDRAKWNDKLRADLCQSVSTHGIPGTIFLSPSVLRTPYHAAEALFHEAGHKKLSDLVFTRSIFRTGYSEKDSPTIRAVWNRSLVWNSADWSIDRALFAAHVYVHLGLFFAMLKHRLTEFIPRFGSLDGMNPAMAARGAFYRARYLLREIRVQAPLALGADGIACLDWLQGVLDRLDPSPPVSDPDIHLWLDRYDRETREVSMVLSAFKEELSGDGNDAMNADYSTWSARRLADHLMHSEIVSAYRLLSMVGERESPTFTFYDGDRWSSKVQSGASLVETIAAFVGIRTFVSRTLRNLPEAAYARLCHTRRTKTLKDMVSDTVEHAGRHLDDLISHARRQRHKAGVAT